jgi:GST-like protein
MTESLAMLHYVNDGAPRGLIRRRRSAAPVFYRWASFLIAAVYPTFTYGDDPKKWVADEKASKMLRESTDAHARDVAAAEGDRRRAVVPGRDAHRARPLHRSMTRWRPGRKWFAANTPKLVAIAEKTTALARGSAGDAEELRLVRRAPRRASTSPLRPRHPSGSPPCPRLPT